MAPRIQNIGRMFFLKSCTLGSWLQGVSQSPLSFINDAIIFFKDFIQVLLGCIIMIIHFEHIFILNIVFEII